MWKQKGIVGSVANKKAQEYIKHVNGLKSFTALAECEIVFPGGNGYQQLVLILDNI
jgi:hypothetical protein